MATETKYDYEVFAQYEQKLRLVRDELEDTLERCKWLEYENKRLRKALKSYGWKDIGK